MTLRYLAVVLMLAVIGAGLLGLRQQQLNDKHAIAESHAQMKNDREAIKDLQVRIARMTTPEALQDAIDRSLLDLQPITKQAPSFDPPHAEPAEPADANTTSDATDTTPPPPPATTTADEPRDG